MKIMLTERVIDSLAIKPDRHEVTDQGCTGLVLLISPTGSKTFIFRYRSPYDGKSRKLSLGRWPSLDLKNARATALEHRALIQRGEDPRISAKVNQHRHAPNLNEMAERWRQKNQHLKQIDRDFHEYEKIFAGKLGDLPIDVIDWRSIAAILDDVVLAGFHGKANKGQSILSRIFSQAREDGEIEHSIMAAREFRGQKNSRTRVLSDDELRELWAATDTKFQSHRALRMQLLCGQRRSEIVSITRSRIDFDRQIISMRDSDMKKGRPHMVPITTAMAEIITQQNGDAVFRGRYGKTLTPGAMNSALKKTSITDIGTHDLRRTMVTRLRSDELGFDKDIVKRIISHKIKGDDTLDAHYDVGTHIERKRRVLEAWNKYLFSVIKGVDQTVLPFERRIGG